MLKYKKLLSVMCLLLLSNNLLASVPTLVLTEKIPEGVSVEVIDSQNNYLYIGSDKNKVSIVDITEPSSATVVNVVDIDAPTPGDLSFLAIDSNDEYLYVLAGTARKTLVAINIENPLSAFVVDTLTITSLGGEFIAIDSANDYLYVYGTESIDVIDISNPANLTLKTTVPFTRSSGFLSNIVIDSQEKYLYAFERSDTANITLSVLVIDISNPPTASLKKRLKLGSFAGVPLNTANFMRLDSTDSYLYVTNNQNNQIVTINVTNPINATITDTINTTTPVESLVLDVADTYLYAGIGGSDVFIYGLSDPANPQEINTLSVDNSRSYLTLDPSDTNLYVVNNGGEKVFVFDVSNPLTPVKLTEIVLDNPSFNVIDSMGSFLYIIGGSGSLPNLYVIFNPVLPPINGLTCSTKVVNYPPKDRINVLKWGPADTQGTVYIINRNGAQIATELQNALGYEDHVRPKGKTDTYTVQGVNSFGAITPVATCTVEVAN